MTVIKRKEQQCAFPSANSENNSDTESLDLENTSGSSDSVSTIEQASPRRDQRLLGAAFCSQVEERLTLKRALGKRKLRRYNNRLCLLPKLYDHFRKFLNTFPGWLLQTLAEGAEDDNEGSAIVMEPYRGPFTRLLESQEALDLWHDFIEKSETDQKCILDALANKKTIDNEHQNSKTDDGPRIPNFVKRTLKIKKDLSLEKVKQSEEDLIAFFKCTPTEIYIKCLSTYFERLLLHTMAQYHGLKSLVVDEEGQKKVEVFNTLKVWLPTSCYLTDLIAQLRTKNETVF